MSTHEHNLRPAYVEPDLEGMERPTLPDDNPDWVRFGVSFHDDIHTGDLTGSRSIGYSRLPMRALIPLRSEDLNAPSEQSFEDTTDYKSGRAYHSTAAQRARYLTSVYGQRGWVTFTALTNQESTARAIYEALMPVNFQTLYLWEIKADFDQGGPESRLHDLPAELFTHANPTLTQMRQAFDFAWSYLNETLDQTETEMQQAANGGRGKKRYDRLDEHAYIETGRTKREYKQVEATANLTEGMTAAVREVAGGQSEAIGALASSVAQLAKAQTETAERQARAEARSDEKFNSLLAALAGKPVEERTKRPYTRRIVGESNGIDT